MKVLLVSEGKHEESGALESLVRRTTPKIELCSWDRVSSNRIETQRGKGQGFFKRAVRWMREAQKRGYDALILVIDEDGDRERIREIAEAQREMKLTIGFPRALGVAIHRFDAWILADEKTLAAILGFDVPTQPMPEEMADPKGTCAELLHRSSCGISQRELYARVAEAMSLPSLECRCPKGFGEFAARLRNL